MTAQSDKFRALLEKYPERRIQTLGRMRHLLASHALARRFGQSMKEFYVENPRIGDTDKLLKDMIIEYEGIT